MKRRFYLLMLLPAVSLALFLVELFRRHGYESLGHPLLFTIVAMIIIVSVAAFWVAYSLFLSRFADISLDRALLLDLFSYLPFLLLLAYFFPAIRNLLNIGTFLFFFTLGFSVALKAAVLLYYHRSTLEALFSRSYLILGLVVVLALLLRVGLIAANRFHGDEALYSHWGLLIASGEDIFLKNVIVDKPPVFLYTLAFFFKVFGPTETAARLPNMIASLASVVLLYQIALGLFDHRVAMMSAVFLAFSPFDIQFAGTAFTDPLMVSLALASCLLTLRGRYLGAGVVMGLAVMTKPLALFFLPLLLFFAAVPRTQEGWRRRFGEAGLRFGLGFMAVIFAVVGWDVIVRVNCINFLSASAARYGGLGLVPLERILPRVRGWMGQLKYLTGSRPLNIILIVGVPWLLSYGLWHRRIRQGWLYDWVLTGFCLYFVGLHTLLSFSIWDRYLLGLVPVVAIMLSRVVLLPYDVFLKGEGFGRRRVVYFSVLGVLLAASLLQPTQVALRYGFPVGGDHGAFQGIEDVASYFKGNVPGGSIVFHKWLGWHYSFYMFDLPLEFYYYPSHEFVLDTAQRLSTLEKYIVFPSWTNSDELAAFLGSGGWELREMYRTYRPDGSVSFTIYRIQPMGE
jgi:4-amino-4-deoxy-L-arabinose transferase-like glycosyltransferase